MKDMLYFKSLGQNILKIFTIDYTDTSADWRLTNARSMHLNWF